MKTSGESLAYRPGVGNFFSRRAIYVGRHRSSRAGLVMSKKKKKPSRPGVDPEDFGGEGMKF